MTTLRLLIRGLIISAIGLAGGAAIVFFDLFLVHHGVGVFGIVAIWLVVGAVGYTVSMKIMLARIKKP